MDMDPTTTTTTSTANVHQHPKTVEKSQIDHITSLASTLLSLGDVDIYNKTYEHLLRSVRSKGDVEADWEPESANPKFEYKWDIPQASDKPGEEKTYGPYGEADMKAWFGAQYFGATGEKVKVRRVGQKEWGSWEDVMEQ